MALPLPRVVADVGPGGPMVTSMRGMNALTASNLENQINQAKAEYAPYTERANALSKTAYARYLPYQIQAQIMSNPALLYMLKDNPDAIKAIFSSFSNSIPNINNLENEIPQPGQMNRGGGGLINYIRNLMGGGNQQMPMGMPQNPMQQAPIGNTGSGNPMAMNQPQPNGNPNPLVPSANGDPIQTMINKATAGYQAETQKPGTTFATPQGDVISSPTEATRTAAQTAIGAAERVMPQLTEISDAAGPFLTLGGMGNLGYQAISNMLSPDEQKKLPTQYARYKSLIKSAPEALVKAYGLNPTNETIDRMEKIIEPFYGETKDQYKNRILQTLESIKNEQIATQQKNLSRGFEVEKGRNNKNISAKEAIKNEGKKFKNEMIQMEGPDPKDNNKIKRWNVPQGQVQLYLDNGFKRI